MPQGVLRTSVQLQKKTKVLLVAKVIFKQVLETENVGESSIKGSLDPIPGDLGHEALKAFFFPM